MLLLMPLLQCSCDEPPSPVLRSCKCSECSQCAMLFKAMVPCSEGEAAVTLPAIKLCRSCLGS